MQLRHVIVSGIVLLATTSAGAEEVRYFEKDGITYREARRTVRRPIAETRLEDREQTVYREQRHTEYREETRNYVTPQTRYEWRTCLKNRWNPFTQPYLTQQLVPIRSWESREEVVQIPVTRRELVAEKRTVKVPVTTRRIAEEEVITRTAVNPTTTRSALLPVPSSGDGLRIGGVARLENDPPRRATIWRPSGDTSLRR